MSFVVRQGNAMKKLKSGQGVSPARTGSFDGHKSRADMKSFFNQLGKVAL